MACVAPIVSANARLAALGSTATMVLAPAMRGALQHELAHASAADDRDRVARLHPGGVERGADAGRDAAADQGELIGREVGLHRDQRGLVGVDRLGERAQPAGHQHGSAVVAVAADRGGQPEHAGAVLRRVVAAVPAVAAGRRERGDDPVTDPHPGDVPPDGPHDPGALVAEHRGRGHQAAQEREVGVAHARRLDLDLDVVVAQLDRGQLLHLERTIVLDHHRGAHGT